MTIYIKSIRAKQNVPIGLSILCFFIPGGANLLLLLENETRFENMTDFFNNQIGANQYFTGSGVTVSDKAGIGSTEFAFINNDCKFNVEQINKKYPGTCHIVRLETDDSGMFILKK